MGSHSRLVVSMLSALIITCLCSSAEATTSPYCGLAVYWGREGYNSSLGDLCNSGLYRYVIAAEYDISPSSSSSGDGVKFPPLIIPNISSQVRECQSKGIKVLVSITGGDKGGPAKAIGMAVRLWLGFIADKGNPLLPFRGSNFDGFDFAVTRGNAAYYKVLTRTLRQLANAVENRTVYLSASPDCAYPSRLLRTAINNGYFDFVWPNFYNDATCDFSNGGIDGLVSSWNKWIDNSPEGTETKYFMGLPAAPEAAKTGFVPRDILAYEILPRIRYNKLYTGVKLWDWYNDTVSGYGQSVRAPVCDYTDVPSARQKEWKIAQVV